MSAAVTSLEEFLAKRARPPADDPRRPLAGFCVYSDGSFRVVEQTLTAAQFAALFEGLAKVCEAMQKLYAERVK